jgi:dienelactone hydrolase
LSRTLALALVGAALLAWSAMAEPLAGTGFDRHATTDAFGRRITFYLSETSGPARRIALFVQGSGCTPVLRREGDRLRAGYASVLAGLAGSGWRVLAVEKPGVEPEAPGPTDGSAEGCAPEFHDQHTLERWLAALQAVLTAARALPGSLTDATLVIGHSEGGTAAARLARDDAAVSHVALLATGGQGVAYDMTERARLAARALGQSEAEAVAAVAARLREIGAAPDRTDRMAWGHPFRRWASFLGASPVADLAAAPARIFLAHGTRDDSIPVASFDLTVAALVARVPVAWRLDDADHSFNRPGERAPAGMEAVFRAVLRWAAGQ